MTLPAKREPLSKVLLSIAYFPPVEYFAVLAEYSSVYLEAHENYIRQTWRNRCRVLTANGPMDLRFPVVHDGERRVRHIRVDYKTPWVEKTEQAIDSAYRSSPFFEYYRDALYGILDSHPETLWELDLSIMRFFISKIGLRTELLETSSFIPPVIAPSVPETIVLGNYAPCGRQALSAHGAASPAYGNGAGSGLRGNSLQDLRYSITPKKPSSYVGRPYWQVFREKFGFVPGLSIMDLLFNEGPESLCYF